MWPAAFRIAGTSGSDTNAAQPAASQSNSTQTRPCSVGSRNTVAPLDPCCARFSAPFVEKTSRKRSTSSICVVARIMAQAPSCGAITVRPEVAGRSAGVQGVCVRRRRLPSGELPIYPRQLAASSLRAEGRVRHDLVLQSPPGGGGSIGRADLRVDVLDVVIGRL